ncbi:hypothetical protein ACAF76_010100 [Brevibacillus sp. TJ4]|uniref:hypothetical protein n=1 Tax=Brevibacillus sp. TJ4 TaxID=3234853 RepID=UPI003B9EDD18
MRWGIMLGKTVVVVLIFLFEWPKIKSQSKKDKRAFLTLLGIGWVLFLFDLPNIPGPTTLLDTIFKPITSMMR